MALVVINSQFGSGGSGLSDGTLRKAIKELQGEKTVVLSGAAANTNIAVAGIKTTDTLKSAILFDGGVPSDVLSATSITSAGNVRNTADTTGKKIVLTYYPKP